MVTHYLIYLFTGEIHIYIYIYIYIFFFVRSKASYYLHSKAKCQPSERWQRHHCHQEEIRQTNAQMLTLVLIQMTCVWSLFMERYYRTVFSDNKKSRLEKANSYTQKHKHKYFNFQLAVRVISLTYTSRKLDKVIFGTVRLPNTPPLSASFVCQVPNVAWQSLCNEHFLPRYHPIFWATTAGGRQSMGTQEMENTWFGRKTMNYLC